MSANGDGFIKLLVRESFPWSDALMRDSEMLSSTKDCVFNWRLNGKWQRKLQKNSNWKINNKRINQFDTWVIKQIESSSAIAHVILPLMISSSLELGSVIKILSNNPKVTEMGALRRTSWVVSAAIGFNWWDRRQNQVRSGDKNRIIEAKISAYLRK